MSALQIQDEGLVADALRVYEEDLKERLEADHFGEIIAVEPKSREFVLGKTYREIEQARQERFGTNPVYTFRIGGGGAVKIGESSVGGSRVAFEPEGFSAISRWLSAAIPPGTRPNHRLHPEGMTAQGTLFRLASLRDASAVGRYPVVSLRSTTG